MTRVSPSSCPSTVRAPASRVCLWLSLASSWLACVPSPAQPVGPPVDYASQIRPILEERCYPCHGGDVRAPSGRLRLHSEERALKGGRSGSPAIVPGDGAASPLILSMTRREPDVWRAMPPPGYPAPTSEEILLIERWIDEGARWPEPN